MLSPQYNSSINSKEIKDRREKKKVGVLSIRTTPQAHQLNNSRKGKGKEK